MLCSSPCQLIRDSSKSHISIMDSFLGTYMIKAMCLYVNQTRAPDVPVNPCIWTSYIASTYFMSENNSLALADWSSQYLGLDTFFDAERIFIPIGSAINNIDPVTDRKLEDHAALIVISPIYKTVDYLDSSPTLTRSSGVETKVFEKVFHLLSHHLGRKFIWPDWRMRKLKAVVDTNRSGACVLYVLANVMCVAFGYSLDYSQFDINVKRRRVTSEFLKWWFRPIPRH